ncbi:MASE3 domain-containing protein [Desulfovibrio inopinatus]|uniref:sensor histidine kinase n=1 Tax=Desulfovibrio inopinatus TaxID=102109 RepID=UPI000419879C|nr:MASE3 domain-containing protein [Desulfovibrio inopinatus]
MLQSRTAWNHPLKRQIIIGGIFFVTLVLASLYGFLLFHCLAEMFSVVIACGVFFVAWNTRHYLEDHSLALAGCIFLAVAGFDFLHLLAYEGMQIFPGYNADLPTQLWIVGRYFEVSALLSIAFLAGKKIHLGVWYSLLSGLFFLCVIAIFTGVFPACYINGQGLTSFKIGSEYFVMGGCILATYLFFVRRSRFDSDVIRYYIASALLTFAAEFAFTVYINIYGLTNIVGHFFKVGAYYFFYRAAIETGLSQPFALIFKDLKMREDELAQERELLITLVNATEDLVVLLKPDGTLVAANQALQKHFDLSEQGITVQNFFSLAPQGMQDGRKSAIATCLKTGQPVQIEEPGPDSIYYTSYYPVYAENGNIRLIAVFSRDITEMKRLDALREDVDRIMRHDLKNPLNVIIGFPRLLEEEGDLNDLQLEYLKHIREAGLHMLEQINQSLSLYRIERGTYDFQPSTVDLGALLQRVCGDMMSKAKAAQVHLYVDVCESSPLALADENLSYSMFANLIDNAIDGSNSSDGVFITMPCPRGDMIDVAIHNALPIPAEILDRFFEKYVTKGKRNGTGLGAYSARLLALAQNGDIVMDSDEHSGTTITVRLPAAS